MHYVSYVKSCLQGIATSFLQFITIFSIITSLLYGSHLEAIEENSRNKRYVECIEGDCINGKGTMIYYSTQTYIGEFKDGQRHGYGTLHLPLGREIKGTWRNDEIVEGTATFSDGTRYTGTWEFGYRHGKGELIYPDGRKYIGEFHAGNKHGQGTMVYPDGRVYTGRFKEGQRTGYGTMTYPDGKKISGRFLNGEYVGPGKISIDD